MKSIIRIIALSCLTAIAAISMTYAAPGDTVQVTEGGGGGAYATIQAAIDAANENGVVVVHPKNSNVPYIENINLNKSLTLMCANIGQYFHLQGDVTVTPAVGRKIHMTGMRITGNGNISASTSSPVGARCQVNIHNCVLEGGDIAFSGVDYFNVIVSGDSLKGGGVAIRYGKVIGNYISSLGDRHSIYINNDAVANNDTIYIVGNHILGSTGYQYYGYLSCIRNQNSSQFLAIHNNYMEIRGGLDAGNYGNMGFYSGALKNAGSTGNSYHTIYNNTVTRTSGVAYAGGGIYVYGGGGNTRVDVMNNLILASAGGLYVNPSSIAVPNVSYNYLAAGLIFGDVTNNGTNVIGTNSTLTSDFSLTGGSDGINAGNPLPEFKDHDLSRNDVGVHGGSFKWSNFHPFNNNNNPRVFFLKAPRKVMIGTPINILAEGYAK